MSESYGSFHQKRLQNISGYPIHPFPHPSFKMQNILKMKTLAGGRIACTEIGNKVRGVISGVGYLLM